MEKANTTFASAVLKDTIDTAEVKYGKEIDLINQKIIKAVQDVQFSVKVQVSDIENLKKIGGTLKQYFLYCGFDVTFYSSSSIDSTYLNISWMQHNPNSGRNNSALACPINLQTL